MNRIYTVYGEDPKAMVKKLLETAGIANRVKPDMRIVLKPNLVVAGPASLGAVTHPEIAAGIIEFLRELGCGNIDIIEGAWVGEITENAFRYSGFYDMAKSYGVNCHDLKKDAAAALSYGGQTVKICKRALDADFLINIPVLKAHCQTRLTCAMKNLKGCIPDAEKRRFHNAGLHRPIAALAKLLPQHLIIVDGICGDLTFEEGGNPVPMNMLLLGDDPVLIDSYAAELIGYAPVDIEYIPIAQSFGVGRIKDDATEIIELDADKRPEISRLASRQAERLSRFISENSACSACYGALIHALNRMDPHNPASGGKICIGQGYRGQGGEIGVGACCRGFDKNVPGCPPTAHAILEFLKGL